MAVSEAVPEPVFRKRVAHYYRRCRAAQIDRLRAAWEFACFVAPMLPGAGARTDLSNLSNALDRLDVRAIVEDMRASGVIGWRYKTVQTYAILARHNWKDVAAQGSVRRALAWARDQKRSDRERAEMAAKRQKTRNREREWEAERFAWAAEREELRSKLKRALAEIARLREQISDLQEGTSAPPNGADVPYIVKGQSREWR